MAKRITLIVPTSVVVRDRDLELLSIIDHHTLRPGAKTGPVAIKELAAELGTSADTCRRATQAAEEAGYLRVSETWLSNGGRAQNSFALTDRGRAVLDAARTAGYVA